MRMKKIVSFVMAAVIAAGVCTGVPIGAGNNSPLAVTAEAAESDFVIETDEEVGKKYLAGYKGKGGDIVIPKEVELIDPEVFAGNSNIKSVTFKADCVWVCKNAFSECENLKKVVFEGDAIILNEAFSFCFNLESVTIKGSISDGIYPVAFKGCHNLKTVKICKNENEFAIGAGAFRDCYSLSTINIPSKCTDIYGYAFFNCFSLENLTIPANTKICEDEGHVYNLGYVSLYKLPDDFYNATFEGKEIEMNTFVADGKTSGYAPAFGDAGLMVGSYATLNMDSKKYTPKKLTLTVTKGSQAEKWAKKNKVAYTYEKASSDSKKVSAPANIKSSKTKNSVTLTWDKTEGADMYRVYIYNDKSGKYEKYKDVKDTKCKITKLKAGTKYKFKVTAYDKVDGKYVKGGTSKTISVTTKK